MRLSLKIPPVALGIIAISLIWICHRFVPLYQINFLYQKILAALLIGAGIAVALLGVFTFIKMGTTFDPRVPKDANALVAIGIYRYSRNPMYLGLLLVIIGMAVYWGALSGILVIFAFIGYMNKYQIAPEEAALREKFGKHFIDYTQKVRRWI